MTAFLASVRTVAEAQIALAGGADVIDLKDPGRGALAALDAGVVAAIVAEVAGRAVISATTGDVDEPFEVQVARARTWHGLGVDVVKFACPAEPASAASRVRAWRDLAAEGVVLVAVLAADAGAPPADLLALLARAQVRGVMLDTLDKRCRSLRELLDDAGIARFVRAARASGLWVGLAGSLRASDIAPLLALAPDYLGFRGALCTGAARAAALDAGAVRAIRARIPATDAAPGRKARLPFALGGLSHEMA